MKRTPNQVLDNAREVLEAVRHATEDFENAESFIRAKTAVRNFLEQGRSVTWTLEHLKSEAENDADWDQWWEKTTAALRADPAAQWFYELRNPTIKEGQTVPVSSNAYVSRLVKEFPPPERPKGSKGYLVDATFTPYWVMEDGSQVLAEPLEGIEKWWTLYEMPSELEGRRMGELMHHYIGALGAIIDAAIARFGTPEN